MVASPAKRRRTGTAVQSGPPLSTLVNLKNEDEGRGFGSQTFKNAASKLLDKARVPAVSREATGEILKALRKAILKAEQCTIMWEEVRDWFVPGSEIYLKEKQLNICSKCEEIAVVGSWLLETSVDSREGTEVDIAVKMPTKMFGKRDFSNIRYWWKRALWLGWLARALSKDGRWDQIRIGHNCVAQHVYQPILTVTHEDNPLLTIRVFPWLSDTEESLLSQTEFLQADAMLVSHLSTLHEVSEASPAFSEAVMLLKLWAKRRRLEGNTFYLTSLLGKLLLSDMIPKATMREALMRAALSALANSQADHGPSTLPGTIAPGRGETSRLIFEARSTLAAYDPLPCLCKPRGLVLAPVSPAALFDGFIQMTLCEEGTIHQLYDELNTALRKTGRVKSLSPIVTSPTHMFIGLFFNLLDTLRRVDICEQDFDRDVFKQFWQGKAELRRFKTQGIKYAVVWKENEDPIEQIIQYLTKSRPWIKSGATFISQITRAAKVDKDPGFGKANRAFSQLRELLRRCEGVPLQVSSLQTSSAFLRRTSVCPVQPLVTSRFVEPIEVILSYESSSAWPLNAVAIAASKAAFYCTLSSALRKQGVKSTPAISHVDVLLSDFYFRIILSVPNERRLLNKRPAQRLHHITEVAPALHDHLRTITNPSFAPAARLAKRWLASHLLLDSMGRYSELVVDVLVAHGYGSGTVQPGSPMAGFVNFLSLLADIPYETEPLVTFLNTDRENETPHLSESQLRSKIAELTYGEKTGGLQIIILGDYETAFYHHEDVPESVIMRKLRSSASAALEWLKKSIPSYPTALLALNWQKLDFRTLLVPDYRIFDVVITVKKQLVSRGKGVQGDGGALVGLDYVQAFVNELRQELGDFCLFLHNRYGGTKVCIVWRPEEDHKFALGRAAYSQILCSDAKMSTSHKTIINSIRRIGGDMVQDIQTKDC